VKKIVILGAGFAGLRLAGKLSQYRVDYEICLIDKKRYSSFSPLLPDVISRGINPKDLICDVEDFAKERCFKFINEEVVGIDLEKKEIGTVSNKISFDYLVIATGTQTNFYGNQEIKKIAYKLDDAIDAEKILADLKEKSFENYIIAGGGYTGVEIASNLRKLLDKKKINKKIFIVERASSILGLLPEWMRNYCLDNLKRLNIEILTEVFIDKASQEKIVLSNKQEFDRAMLIWAAGVKVASFLDDLKVEKNPQGRIKVDKYLRLNDFCFVLGDSAWFEEKGQYLRMAVQFAIKQADSVFVNIINTIYGLPLYTYIPKDLGYIIPMANNRSCGVILGCKFKGRVPTIMHFLMCIYREFSLKNKLGLILDLLKGSLI